MLKFEERNLSLVCRMISEGIKTQERKRNEKKTVTSSRSVTRNGLMKVRAVPRPMFSLMVALTVP